MSQNANTLQLAAASRKLHRNAIDPSCVVHTMRAPQGTGEAVIRKDANLVGRQTRWWSAPLRSPAATLALLRKSGFPRPPLPNDPWLRQAPNGIRV
jgi:hypothetical protein